MIHIDPTELFDAVDATWPPAQILRQDGWVLREGQGGGNRVSAASHDGAPLSRDAVDGAARAMSALGQTPLFMIRPGEDVIDRLLDTLGYAVRDPVIAYAARTAEIAAPSPPVTCFDIWPPLAVQEEIWARGGVGPARLAVMHRVAGDKTSLFGRTGDKPAGTAFAAVHRDLAMIHAIEVAPEHRRRGLARHMVRAAANWAQSRGASTICLLVTSANSPANALYASLGFHPVGHYHYRIQAKTE